MKKYFGTDGVRGEANRELTAETALRLGYALGRYLERRKKTSVIVGMDTRISGAMLCAALAAGLHSRGVDVRFAGVLPTPAVAYLTATSDAGAGVMISASHNPARDNGLKVFGPDGYKLPDDAEEALEKMMDEPRDGANALPGDAVGRFFYEKESYERYKKFLLSSTRGNFQGLKIVIDAANGAAGKIAPDVFETLSAGVRLINAAPDGKNINVACGSTHPEALSRAVLEEKADLGLAFDGDADRLIAADEKGNIVDGDKIIATLAVHMKERNLLPGHKIVTTVMSNMGLEHYLAERGIAMLRAPVGDRYVLEKMREEKAVLGGEQSGHIILSDYAVTGDGVLSALKLLEIVRDGGISL
ncbi:MAG: phosphoglucosamine mutase, partial [Fusobacteriaceae bacterium]|nr:phosphoglucosamine mutase [Fusobacteriaceae bacterium]